MFWDRVALKTAAKAELKQTLWLSMGVCVTPVAAWFLITTIVNFLSGMLYWRSPAYLSIIVGLLPFAALFFFLFPLVVGQALYFVRAPYGDRNFRHMLTMFRREHYLSVVKTMAFLYLKLVLWSLLFVIPGIIKAYQYCMVLYIISENPNLRPSDALKISRIMTDGEKFDIFVLSLSFLGWVALVAFGSALLNIIPLLGRIAFLLCYAGGMVAVSAYMNHTFAQLYFVLRQKYYNIATAYANAANASSDQGQQQAPMQQSEWQQPQAPAQEVQNQAAQGQDPWLNPEAGEKK